MPNKLEESGLRTLIGAIRAINNGKDETAETYVNVLTFDEQMVTRAILLKILLMIHSVTG